MNVLSDILRDHTMRDLVATFKHRNHQPSRAQMASLETGATFLSEMYTDIPKNITVLPADPGVGKSSLLGAFARATLEVTPGREHQGLVIFSYRLNEIFNPDDGGGLLDDIFAPIGGWQQHREEFAILTSDDQIRNKLGTGPHQAPILLTTQAGFLTKA